MIAVSVAMFLAAALAALSFSTTPTGCDLIYMAGTYDVARKGGMIFDPKVDDGAVLPKWTPWNAATTKQACASMHP